MLMNSLIASDDGGESLLGSDENHDPDLAVDGRAFRVLGNKQIEEKNFSHADHC